MQYLRSSALTVLSAVVLVGIASCDVSIPEHARNTATVSDPHFTRALDTITSRSGTVLVCVSYWNGWQAIVRGQDRRNYKAHIWNGDKFQEAGDSPLIKASLTEDVYDHLEPLGAAYQTAHLDYSQVLGTNKDWKLMSKTLNVLPVPSRMAIKLHGRVRPLWVLTLSNVAARRKRSLAC